MPFTRIAFQSELPPLNEAKEFPCGNKTICLANVNGEICAMDNVCLHMGGPLGEGVVDGRKVICPWHGWAYDPRTGITGDSEEKLETYPVKVENGDVLVDIP